MKKLFFIPAVCCMIAAAAADGLLLHASFDKFTTRPDHVTNPQTKCSGIRSDLQMRMYDGPRGKKNAVLLDNTECVGYTAKQNFNLKTGTISFWVKPINWQASNQGYQTFFEVRGGNFRLIINKEVSGNLINFMLIVNGKSYVTRQPCKWSSGQWHMLTCTWNESRMLFYVDGQAPGKGSRGEYIFKNDPQLPAHYRHARMRLNFHQGWRVKKEWKTAYDDLKIYDRVLSPGEILAEYEKVVPPEKDDRRPYALLPAVLPVSSPYPGMEHEPAFDATVSVREQAGRLIFDFYVPRKSTKHNITFRDGQIWLDDSAELHIIGGDGKQRQFIINSIGAVYDSLDKNIKWNADIKSSARRYNDSWTAHLEIPLKDLGGGRKFKANFCVSDPRSQYRLFTWSPLQKRTSFSAKEYFGTIELGSGKHPVQLTSFGDLRSGRLDLQYQLVPGVTAKIRALSAGGGVVKTAKAVLPAGKSDISFEAFDAKGNLVFSSYRTAVINHPLTMTALALYHKNELEFRLDFSASGRQNGSGEVALLKDGKVYAAKKFSSSRPECTVTLPLPGNLPDNTAYTARATVGSLVVEQPFRIPDLAPLKAKTAVDHSVPAPWKPVQRQGEKLLVLDRVYRVDRGPLPAGILSRGREQIARQPEFVLNGKTITWGKVRFGKNHGDYAELTAEGHFPGGRASIKGELWFDGMYKFDLSLKPSGPLAIRSFDLQWSVPAAQARYALTPEYTPWVNNRIDLKWDTWEYNSLLWLTGVETGLAWWCRSDANWIIDPAKHNISVIRRKDAADVRICMIAKAAVLKKQADYTMVFQATPPKQADWNEREINSGLRWYKSCDVVEMQSSARNGKLDPEDFKHWMTLIPWDIPAMRKSLQTTVHARGYKSQMYSMPTHISRLDPEYDYFIRYSAISPSTLWRALDARTQEHYVVEPCCGNTPIADIHAWRLDKLFRDVPEIDGMYFDISHVRQCENPHHGCGGIDAFGKKYSSSFALNLRSYLLRVLKINQKHKKRLGLHAHNAFYPFVHDLCSFWMPGEELFYDVDKNPEWGYLEFIPEKSWQSAWNSNIRGVYLQVIGQHDRLTRVGKYSKKKHDLLRSREWAIHFLTPMVLFDCDMQAFGSQKKDHPMFDVWRIRKELNLAKAVYHGYWYAPIAASAPEIRVSWYSWEGKARSPRLFCVGNLSRKTVKTGIVFDWKKIGIPAPAKLKDLWTGRSFTETELAAYPLAGHNFMMLIPEQ